MAQDVYGNRLIDAVRQNFEARGGRVVDGVGYSPPTGHFAISLNRINLVMWDDELKSLRSKVDKAIARYGSDEIGIYLVAFDEVVPIFIQAQDHQELSKTKWYGSDGSVLNKGLLRNIDAAKFAVVQIS